MTTVEMGAEQFAYGRPAPDAFDLPAALAARERRAASERAAAAERLETQPEAARPQDLPPVFVPSSGR